MTIPDKHFPPNLLSSSAKGDPGMSIVRNKFQLHYKVHWLKKKSVIPKSMVGIDLFFRAEFRQHWNKVLASVFLIVSDVNASGRCCHLLLSLYKNETDKPVDTSAPFQPVLWPAASALLSAMSGYPKWSPFIHLQQRCKHKQKSFLTWILNILRKKVKNDSHFYAKNQKQLVYAVQKTTRFFECKPIKSV
jgi:hypothetical protein